MIDKIKKSKIKISIVIIIILVALGVLFLYISHRNKNDTTTGIESPYSSDGINYQPATEAEKQDSENIKKSISEDSGNDSSDDSKIKSVKPVITYSGVYEKNVEVNSYVPNIFENSGKCTLTLKLGDKTIKQSKDASQNVSEMSCGLIKIPLSKLSSGKWSATISYDSSKAKGVSDAQQIEVN